jgi:lysophospholipase L1-like esterase
MGDAAPGDERSADAGGHPDTHPAADRVSRPVRFGARGLALPGVAQRVPALLRGRREDVLSRVRGQRLRAALAVRGGERAALAPKRTGERRVVFFGDSITDNWSKAGYGGFFPGRPYINRGIGGQTTAQMLLRFQPDVITLQPDAVVILAGTNDIAGNAGPVTVEAVEQNLATMSELAKLHGIRVVLASILPVSDDKRDAEGRPLLRTQDRPLAKIRALNAWMQDYARRNGHVYLDYYSAAADVNGLLKPDLNDDGLHPNAAGYAVMAPRAEQAIAEALTRR